MDCSFPRGRGMGEMSPAEQQLLLLMAANQKLQQRQQQQEQQQRNAYAYNQGNINNLLTTPAVQPAQVVSVITQLPAQITAAMNQNMRDALLNTRRENKKESPKKRADATQLVQIRIPPPLAEAELFTEKLSIARHIPPPRMQWPYNGHMRMDIRTPHPNDVLCGRGGGINQHPGNKKYRELVQAQKDRYLRATKREKVQVSQGIVRAVRCQNPPGRFLNKDGTKGGSYYDIGDQRAREKTSQALREGAPDIREQITTVVRPSTAQQSMVTAISPHLADPSPEPVQSPHLDASIQPDTPPPRQQTNQAGLDLISLAALQNGTAAMQQRMPMMAGQPASQNMTRNKGGSSIALARAMTAMREASNPTMNNGLLQCANTEELKALAAAGVKRDGTVEVPRNAAGVQVILKKVLHEQEQANFKPTASTRVQVPQGVAQQALAKAFILQQAQTTLGRMAALDTVEQEKLNELTLSSLSDGLIRQAHATLAQAAAAMGTTGALPSDLGANMGLHAALMSPRGVHGQASDIIAQDNSTLVVAQQGLSLPPFGPRFRRGVASPAGPPLTGFGEGKRSSLKRSAANFTAPNARREKAAPQAGNEGDMEDPATSLIPQPIKVAKTAIALVSDDVAHRLILAETIAQCTLSGSVSEPLKAQEKRMNMYLDAGLLGIDLEEMSERLQRGETEEYIVEDHYNQLLEKSRKAGGTGQGARFSMSSAKRPRMVDAAKKGLNMFRDKHVQDALVAIGA